jgi:hypothetical protein
LPLFPDFFSPYLSNFNNLLDWLLPMIGSFERISVKNSNEFNIIITYKQASYQKIEECVEFATAVPAV